jgi:hypothetical protein
MNTKISTIDADKQIVAPHSQEVEFALLISQMINTVKEDPEQLRLTIYDLARTKLKNDMVRADEQERTRLQGALETAIIGVEQFSQRPTPPRQRQLPGFSEPSAEATSHLGAPPLLWLDPETEAPAPGRVRFGSGAKLASRRARPVQTLLIVGLMAIAVGAGGAYYFQRHGWWRDATKAQPETAKAQSDSAPVAVNSAPPAANTAPAQPSFPVPSVYGVYALDNGKLSELEVLPAQVPDRRVAISTPITSPSVTILPQGDLKFIVFRRDIAANAPERVEVRVVAQVMRAIAFDASGKRSITPVSDAWSIRNIAHVLRVRPVPGNPEMILIQAEGSDALSPGRYALALQGQAYDFTVGGQIKDVAQCLERTEAANGTFYSECQDIKR